MRYLTYSLSCISFLIYSSLSFSCSCIERKSEDYLANCEILFTAVLTESKLEKIDGPIKVEIGKVENISHIIKGQPNSEYLIENTRLGTSCDSNLMVGEEYVVCVNPGQKLKLQACGYTHVLYYGGSEAFVKSLGN